MCVCVCVCVCVCRIKQKAGLLFNDFIGDLFKLSGQLFLYLDGIRGLVHRSLGPEYFWHFEVPSSGVMCSSFSNYINGCGGWKEENWREKWYKHFKM